MTGERPDPPRDAPPPEPKPAILRAEDLLAGAKEVRIELKGEFYCLRLTKRGRLILTK